MKKKVIRLTESDLHRIIKESVYDILVNESLFSRENEMLEPTADEPKDHTYTEKEMQWLYDNQKDLSPIERDVLNAGMWVRAMQANYHGYAKRWPNIILKNGETFYYDKKGNIRKTGT